MDQSQYLDYKRRIDNGELIVRISTADRADGTMLYGYTYGVNDSVATVHVYVKDGELHHIRYYRDDEILIHDHGEDLPVRDLLQGIKRVYPESCDHQFCLDLMRMGEVAATTTFNPERYEKVKGRLFHGLLHDDFSKDLENKPS